MADITKWNQFWESIFHPRRAQKRSMDESRAKVSGNMAALIARQNYRAPLPEGFTVKYAMLYGFPHVILYHGDKKISDQMVHNNDTNKAYRAMLDTARFIAENNIDV